MSTAKVLRDSHTLNVPTSLNRFTTFREFHWRERCINQLWESHQSIGCWTSLETAAPPDRSTPAE